MVRLVLTLWENFKQKKVEFNILFSQNPLSQTHYQGTQSLQAL